MIRNAWYFYYALCLFFRWFATAPVLRCSNLNKRDALGGKLEADFREIRVGKEKAEKYVIQILKELNLPKINKKHLYGEIAINQRLAGAFIIDLKGEIDFVRKNGKANILQQMLDQNDRFLSSPISIAIMGDDTGVQIDLGAKYENHSENVKFPGGIESP